MRTPVEQSFTTQAMPRQPTSPVTEATNKALKSTETKVATHHDLVEKVCRHPSPEDATGSLRQARRQEVAPD